MNPTDNQTPQPVEAELEEILSLIQAVKHYPGAHSMKIVGKSEAKARLLQWGTRQRISELDQLLENMYEGGYPDGCQVVHEHDIADRISELQASLKDGGKTE